MASGSNQVILRPSIINPRLWHPQRPPRAEWERIRKVVLERDNWTCAGCGHRAIRWMNVHHIKDSSDNSPENLVPLCVACHAVLHIGLSLQNRFIEIWESEISQVEIVTKIRANVMQGLTLTDIKKQLPLRPGPYPPNSIDYANDLIRSMGNTPRSYLEEPLCAVFVNFTRWQIEEP